MTDTGAVSRLKPEFSCLPVAYVATKAEMRQKLFETLQKIFLIRGLKGNFPRHANSGRAKVGCRNVALPVEDFPLGVWQCETAEQKTMMISCPPESDPRTHQGRKTAIASSERFLFSFLEEDLQENPNLSVSLLPFRDPLEDNGKGESKGLCQTMLCRPSNDTPFVAASKATPQMKRDTRTLLTQTLDVSVAHPSPSSISLDASSGALCDSDGFPFNYRNS
ncbi:hypothetical protein CDAR_16871 [Caerostris darwini]|uniref:Uncharacterized protein n=1 Tax=Caerostris darwini TaxID=1538125 RepID=A0AAV4P6V2_9ARAC|nr:hypothetical protein CDAR_16871 [Caerostris darwini]